MARFNDDDFAQRRDAADKAKKAMLERFRAKPGENDPATIEKKAARVAVSDAREARKQLREEAAKKREEEAAQQARDQVEQDAAASRAEADRKVTLLASQKTARDARYAARKARR